MFDLSFYPLSCRNGIKTLMRMLSSDAETVFSMMRMTASIMDLDISDKKVINAILMDCGIENVSGDKHEDSRECQ